MASPAFLDRQENAAGQRRQMLGGRGGAGLGEGRHAGIGNLVGRIRVGQGVDPGPAQIEQFHDLRDPADFLEDARDHFLGFAISPDLDRVE